MKVTRKLVSLSLLFVVALFVQNVPATTTDILPESSHYEGRSHFSFPTDTGGVAGYIDFAVYDTEGPNGDELAAGGFATAPGIGQYIYAYQIFSEYFSTDVVEYFGIFGIGDNSIAEPLNDNIGEVEDSDDPSEEGVKPNRSYITFTDDDEPEMIGVWEFDNGFLTANTHSWFLVLRSAHDWQPGGYTFEPVATSPSIPGEGNPEPATIGLLGIGTLMLLGRRKSVLVRR